MTLGVSVCCCSRLQTALLREINAANSLWIMVQSNNGNGIQPVVSLQSEYLQYD